jgi:hypothetical protein
LKLQQIQISSPFSEFIRATRSRMDAELKGHGAGRPEVSEAKTSDTTNKSSRQRKQQQWESHREEIHELYMVDNKTLKSTMQIIKNKYNFTPRSAPPRHLPPLLWDLWTACPKLIRRRRDTDIYLVSERKFKEQLKHWAFEKNITATEMGFIAATEESRSREQGKSTTFYNRGIKINPKKN